MISTAMIKAGLRIRIFLQRIQVQIAIFSLSNADPYPDTIFHFNADQSYVNLRPLEYRPSMASFWASMVPFWASMPPLWAFMALQSSVFEPLSILNFDFDQIRIRIQLYTLMWIRIQLPKIMRIRGSRSGPPILAWRDWVMIRDVNYFSKNGISKSNQELYAIYEMSLFLDPVMYLTNILLQISAKYSILLKSVHM
jgi:hypothetical protein